jgi:spermidine/putrescine transport system permease protein
MSVADVGSAAGGRVGTPGGSVTSGDRPPTRRRRSLTGYYLLLPGMLWLLVFFAVPTIQLAATSLYDPNGSLDTGYAMTWSFPNYLHALSDYRGAFLRSLAYATSATVLALLLAYPLAYAIAFKAGRWKNFMLVLVIAPFFTSFLVRTLAWKSILSDNGFVVSTLKAVHILAPDGRLLATSVAVVTGLTYNFLPFMVLPLYASLEKIDLRLIEAGKDLYADGFTAFRKITLPLSMPGVVAGTLLTFIPAAGDYINTKLLGTPAQNMIGNVIDNLFLVQLDYPIAATCSVILMVVIVLMVLVYVRRAGTEELV